MHGGQSRPGALREWACVHDQDRAAGRARIFVWSFRRICGANKIRLIKVHHLRHTIKSLLKDLKVPARDAQTTLGHTRISTTLEIYTHRRASPPRRTYPATWAARPASKLTRCYRQQLQTAWQRS